MQIDALLATVTRRLPHARGFWRLKEVLRRHYLRYYSHSDQAWIIIGDFDGSLYFQLNRASFLGSAIYWYGTASAEERRVLKSLLSPEMVLVDVGANHGEITLLAAKRLTRGQVFAFEPHPHVFGILRQNVELNQLGNVRLHNVALAQAPGRLKLYSNMNSNYNTQVAGIDEGLSSFYTRDESTLIADVEVTTLDEAFKDAHRLDFVKIDVEGSEPQVLRGGESAIQRHRPILMMEVNPLALERAGTTARELLTLVTGWGYRIFRIERKVIVPLVSPSIADFCNVLCLPHERPGP